MTITKVEYSKLLPTGIYSNERIGFEAELGYTPNTDSTDGYPMIPENPLEAISKLRQLAEQSHKEQYPHLYTENGKPITYSGEVPVQQIQDRRINDLIGDIIACTEIDKKNGVGVQVGLLAYKSACNDDPRIKAAYDKKLKSLK